MKYLRSFAVVDVDAENVVSNFFAVNEKMAKRIFDEAYKSVSDDIKSRYEIYVYEDKFDAYKCVVAESVSDIEETYVRVWFDNE